MQIIFFSPTGTTRAIVEAVARGLEPQTVPATHDLTFPRTLTRPQSQPPAPDQGVVILGGPVYGGRLPVLMVERLRTHVRGQGRRAILVVVYGNRAYEDTLLELRDLVTELGFVPVAAAAFIGEHSFSTTDSPIAPERPDQVDLQAAFDFGTQARSKLTRLGNLKEVPPLHVPGKFPYAPGLLATQPIAPGTQRELCTLCGLCAQACPSSAITLSAEEVLTNAELCLRCCACIRVCPMQARVAPQDIVDFAEKLHRLYGHRQEPEFFL